MSITRFALSAGIGILASVLIVKGVRRYLANKNAEPSDANHSPEESPAQDNDTDPSMSWSTIYPIYVVAKTPVDSPTDIYMASALDGKLTLSIPGDIDGFPYQKSDMERQELFMDAMGLRSVLYKNADAPGVFYVRVHDASRQIAMGMLDTRRLDECGLSLSRVWDRFINELYHLPPLVGEFTRPVTEAFYSRVRPYEVTRRTLYPIFVVATNLDSDQDRHTVSGMVENGIISVNDTGIISGFPYAPPNHNDEHDVGELKTSNALITLTTATGQPGVYYMRAWSGDHQLGVGMLDTRRFKEAGVDKLTAWTSFVDEFCERVPNCSTEGDRISEYFHDFIKAD